jgi:uncharacterized protein DUF5763
MSELADLDDDFGTCRSLSRDVKMYGTCQALTRSGKRCHFRAQVKSNGTAYCELHDPKLVEVE